ncbi:MAG: glycosyltransferase [Candidatus Omnitrophota bacterium]|nr:MAG: glycosyltransferase [Candidatus Omnitrophota bacterium]
MDESQSKVSIVLPTYNGFQYIHQSIDSCLNQTHKNIELIIVDDASTDSTPQIIKSYSDGRIHYIRNEANLGLANSLNKGFSYAQGEYFTWTSDDNYYSEQAIQVMAEELKKHRGIDFVYANYYIVNDEGNVSGRERVTSVKKLYLWNCIGACFLYRRSVYETIGEYNPQVSLFEDYEYWLRVRQRFSMKRLNKWLYYYRLHKGSLTGYKQSFIPHDKERYREARIEMRENYISSSERLHLEAENHFHKEEYHSARRLAIKSLLIDIFNFDVWRLLAILFLGPSILKRIKKIKNTI